MLQHPPIQQSKWNTCIPHPNGTLHEECYSAPELHPSLTYFCKNGDCSIRSSVAVCRPLPIGHADCHTRWDIKQLDVAMYASNDVAITRCPVSILVIHATSTGSLWIVSKLVGGDQVITNNIVLWKKLDVQRGRFWCLCVFWCKLLYWKDERTSTEWRSSVCPCVVWNAKCVCFVSGSIPLLSNWANNKMKR